MNTKRTFLSLIVTLVLIFAMTACSINKDSKSKSDPLDQKSAEEIEQMISELQEKEASILQEHEDLWKIFFAAMDEIPTTMELTEDFNYGNYLLESLKTIKDRFSEEDYYRSKRGVREKGITYPNIYFGSIKGAAISRIFFKFESDCTFFALFLLPPRKKNTNKQHNYRNTHPAKSHIIQWQPATYSGYSSQ